MASKAEPGSEDSKHRITDFFPKNPTPKPECEVDRIKSLSKCLAHASDSSVLLTPDHTPTKPTVRHSITTPVRAAKPSDAKLPESSLALSDEDTEPSNQNAEDASHDSDAANQKTGKMSRSQSDSQLDSPRPTQAKLSRSQERPAPASKVGAGRKGKRRGPVKKTEKSSKGAAGDGVASKTTQSRSKATQGNKKSAESQNHKVTDYFPVRRSSRMCGTALKKMEEDDMIEAILEKREVGMKVVEFEGKGRGVVATKQFRRGDFVVEYAGNLMDLNGAKKLEDKYSKKDIGCYMYYFNFQGKNYCIDATAESGRLGRLINHSRTSANCRTRTIDIKDQPSLILVAARNINVGEELLYDYGDRSKTSLEAHPWLAL